jgi:hypothetical protein
MPRSYETLTLEDAKRMLAAAEAKAASVGKPYNIAVVDAAGHLLAFVRQDGALFGSIDLAIDKAATARLFDRSTAELAKLSQPGEPLFGIDHSKCWQSRRLRGRHPRHDRRAHHRGGRNGRRDRRAGHRRRRSSPRGPDP